MLDSYKNYPGLAESYIKRCDLSGHLLDHFPCQGQQDSDIDRVKDINTADRTSILVLESRHFQGILDCAKSRVVCSVPMQCRRRAFVEYREFSNIV